MAKFKIGDKTTLRDDSPFFRVITKVLPTVYKYTLQEKKSGSYYSLFIHEQKIESFDSEEFFYEKKIKNTKIARKLNPNYEIIEGGWLRIKL